MRGISSKTRAVPVAVAIVMFCALPLFANTTSLRSGGERGLRCYCECESADGAAECPMKFCELPKYENRWWATSCHKRAATKMQAAPEREDRGGGNSHAIQTANK
jgi:hypothetical protein